MPSVPTYEALMTTSLVFTLIGPDQPGLVERVATCVAERGGNWEESEFMSLDGQFAGLVRVRVRPDHVAGLRAALETLEGVSVIVAETEAPAQSEHHRLHLELVGADRTGIVRDIGHALAALGVNVTALDTWTERAPMSGEPTFRARARLDAPVTVAEGDLRAALERLANELMVEVTLTEDESGGPA